MPEINMVSNTIGSHLEELKCLFQLNATRLLIVSPFLATDFKGLLAEFDFNNIESIELVTTFKPKDPEQLTKPYLLKDYFEYFINNYPEIKVKLHVDNDLHGKIYVSTNYERSIAILGSANFTRNGLSNNHEWGVGINDDAVIDNIIEDVFNSIEYPEVTYSQIKKSCFFADDYGKSHPEWKMMPDVFSDILDDIYSVDDTSNADPQYFLKPIGHSESPVLLEDQESFSALHQNLHFSKKKPKGVRKGDVVITVAVGGGALLSYFKVTGGLQHVTGEEIAIDSWKARWPWYMEGRNQSRQFSGEWWTHNVQRKNVLNEFLDKFPEIPVTQAGGFNLGTLNRGNDKVRVTKEFGDFLISKIQDAVK